MNISTSFWIILKRVSSNIFISLFNIFFTSIIPFIPSSFVISFNSFSFPFDILFLFNSALKLLIIVFNFSICSFLVRSFWAYPKSFNCWSTFNFFSFFLSLLPIFSFDLFFNTFIFISFSLILILLSLISKFFSLIILFKSFISFVNFFSTDKFLFSKIPIFCLNIFNSSSVSNNVDIAFCSLSLNNL